MLIKKASLCYLVLSITWSINSLHAIDPASIIASVVLDKVVQTSINWFFTESHDKIEYQKRHALLQKQSKDFFIAALQNLATAGGNTFALSHHELYRYPNFIAAVKEYCPQDYAAYIKQLLAELLNDLKKCEVEGFQVKHFIVSAGRYAQPMNLGSYYEFLELIKFLYWEIVQQEAEIITNTQQTTESSQNNNINDTNSAAVHTEVAHA